MSLPSKEAFIEHLAAARGSYVTESLCPICWKDPADVKSPCDHHYCFDCLSAWLESNNTCPICRTELYEKEERRDEEYGVGDELPDIERLDLDFGVDDNLLSQLMDGIYFGEDDHYNVADHFVARVDYNSLLPSAVAYITFIKRDMWEEQRSFVGVARGAWNSVASSIESTLRRLDGREVECGELWDALDRDIVRRAGRDGVPALMYAEGIGGAEAFQSDLRWALGKMVHEAKRDYVVRKGIWGGQAERLEEEEEAPQWPEHIHRFELPFDIDEIGVIHALNQLDSQAKTFDVTGLNTQNLYVSHRRLLPFVVAAIYEMKPACVVPEGTNQEAYEEALCHFEWLAAAYTLERTLRDLHSREMMPDELAKTLKECLGSIPAMEYGGLFKGHSTLQDDIEAMMSVIMFYAVKFGGGNCS